MKAQLSHNSGSRFLFLIYDPTRQQTVPEGSKELSQQKHAAREHHRRAKLLRQISAKGKPSQGVATNTNSESHDSLQSVLPKSTSDFEELFQLCPRQGTMPTDPYSFLSAARLDPFNVYCRQDLPRYVHELLDHALCNQWSVFSPSEHYMYLNAVKDSVMSCAMTTPVSFYTVIFAGACHNAFFRGDVVPEENALLRLSYKAQAIQLLVEEIKRSNGYVSDETLLAMVTLSAHGDGERLSSAPLPEQESSPLTWAVHTFYYGRMNPAMEHFNALCYLIKRRGGLESIQVKGLARAIAEFDIFVAYRHLNMPKLPLITPTAIAVSTLQRTLDPEARSLCGRMVTGFSPRFDFDSGSNKPPVSHLLTIISIVAEIAASYDQYQRCLGKGLGCPDFRSISWARSSVLHDLLSLPDFSDCPVSGQDEAMLFYLLCRASTLCFFQLILHPLPASTGLPTLLAKSLLIIIDRWVQENKGKFSMASKQPSIFLWSIILGGIVADDDSQIQLQFIQHIADCYFKPVDSSWSLISAILPDFLWLKSEMEEDGCAFWNKACRLLQPQL